MAADVSTLPEAELALLKPALKLAGHLQPDTQYHRVMCWFIGGLLLFSVAAAQVTRFKGIDALLDCLPLACLLAGFSYYCHWRKLGRLSEVLALIMWVVAATNALSLLVQAAGRIPSPFIDNSLAHLDGLMHASTGEVVRWVAQHERLQNVLAACYQSIPAFVLASLLLPIVCGRIDDSRCYVLAVPVTGVIIAAIFACWPALGPWTRYHFSPTMSQQAYILQLALLRSNQPVILNVGASGIVTFPSFHAALAVHSAAALWNVRYVRYVALLLAVAICVSTITTGWHYFSDVLGGATLAFASIAIVRWFIDRKINANS